jgi:RecJ-like exonuclease
MMLTRYAMARPPMRYSDTAGGVFPSFFRRAKGASENSEYRVASGEQRDLVCPRCGGEHFRVVYTRRAPGGKIVRSRECRHCGRRVARKFAKLALQSGRSVAIVPIEQGAI